MIQFSELENALLEWVLQNQGRITLSWLFKFKKRNRLGWVTKHEEDASVDESVIAVVIPQLNEPLDAGIIMSFKHHYKSYFIKWLLDQYEAGNDNKLNVLGAIKFIV
ncbi:16665_t:CDS:2 [Cetraspora pellucida]|uniref:16665_t:CDS:1 n=1 Tax=Cetraspora pellucida TaxID=1433469 RepID=A0A9N9ND03_9GLOM|nr:16665_t:CDS:2 [Cetraspora pellucida]